MYLQNQSPYLVHTLNEERYQVLRLFHRFVIEIRMLTLNVSEGVQEKGMKKSFYLLYIFFVFFP